VLKAGPDHDGARIAAGDCVVHAHRNRYNCRRPRR
jgi:hypothetical protein